MERRETAGWRCGLAIFGQPLGTGLCCLVALRYLAFFALPPAWFLAPLAAGLPLGGLLWLRWSWLRERDLGTIGPVAAGACTTGLLVFAGLLQLFDLNASITVLHQPTTAALYFLGCLVLAAPLLLLFGSASVIGLAAFRTGLARLAGNAPLVVSLHLLGLLIALGGYRLLLPVVGTLALLLAGLTCLVASGILIRPQPLAVAVGFIALSLLAASPWLETRAVSLLDAKTGAETLDHWRAEPARVLHDAWTPDCRLTILELNGALLGFYDGMAHWSFHPRAPDPKQHPSAYRQLDLAFALLAQKGDRIAILGAGGGAQVAAALRAGAERVVVAGLLPEEAEVLAGALDDATFGTFSDPRVEIVRRHPRRFIADSNELFDIILLASVGTGLSGLLNLFEPSQTLFTQEAFLAWNDHLAPGGLVIVSSATAVDHHGILWRQSLAQLYDLGLRTRGFMQRSTAMGTIEKGERIGLEQRGSHYLVLGQKGPDLPGRIDTLGTMGNIVRSLPAEEITTPPGPQMRPVITDNRSFAAGLTNANLGRLHLGLGTTGVALLLLLLGLATWRLLRRSFPGGATRWSGHSLGAATVGAAFVALAHTLSYRLQDRLDRPLDAVFVGGVLFILFAAIGCWTLARVPGRALLVANAILAVMIAAVGLAWPQASVVITAVSALAAGSLLVRILGQPKSDPAPAMIWLAYGGMWGNLSGLFAPVVAGLNGQQALAALLFLFAAWAVDRWRIVSAP